MNTKFFVVFISLIAAFGGLLFGFDIAVFSGTIPFIKAHYHLSDAQLGWTGSSLYVGCIAGTFITGYITDRVGRKWPILFSALLFAVSCYMMGWANTYNGLIIWRIIAGLAVGSASMLSPLYIAEISPAKIRGRMVSINQLTIVIGILLAYLSNYFLVDVSNNWRWMFASGAIPSILFFFCVFFVPESPRWLISKGRTAHAEEILAKISTAEEAALEIQKIDRGNTVKQPAAGMGDLFHKAIWPIVLLGIAIAVFQQFSGANVVFFYAPIIFEKAGMDVKNQLFQQILVGLTNLVFTLLAMRLVDKVGRKKLMLIGSMGMAVWLVIIGLCYHFSFFSGVWLTLFVMAFIATYATTLAPVTWVLISEIFPNRVRGRAVSVATGMLWVAAFILSYLFPILFGSDSSSGLLTPLQNFFVFAAINVVYFFILLKFAPETKGKSLEEIEAGFAVH